MIWPFEKKQEEPPRKLTMGAFKVVDCTALLWYRDPGSDAPHPRTISYKGRVDISWSGRSQTTFYGIDFLYRATTALHEHGFAQIGDVIITTERFLAITDIAETERVELHKIVDDPDVWPEEVLHPCNI